jgi:DNA invertase Pin-like site-specific DNA recombinase
MNDVYWRGKMSYSTPVQRFAIKVAAAFQDLEHELSAGPTCSATVHRGRPRAQFTREKLLILRNAGLSWREIAHELRVRRTTARRIYRDLRGSPS